MTACSVCGEGGYGWLDERCYCERMRDKKRQEEVDELERENERLRAEHQQLREFGAQMTGDCGVLRAENEWLRALLRDALFQLPSWNEDNRMAVMNRVRAALKDGKP